MRIINSFEELLTIKNISCSVALGTFDGLHLGHLDVIKTALAAKKKQGLQAVVFTFSNHPMSSIMPELVPPRIIDNATKEELLAAMGVDILINIPFTPKFADLSVEEFLGILKSLGARVAVVGQNYSFGAGGVGNAQTLKEGGASFGLEVIIRPLLTMRGSVISSTRIRNAIAQGKVDMAEQMLGRPYSFKGKVLHGDARGRTMGFPTANLEIADSSFALPKSGVYAGSVRHGDKYYMAAVNLGCNPTFGGSSLRLEAHLLDFTGDLYGQVILVELHQFIREEVTFAQRDSLQKQISEDKKAVEEYFHVVF